MFCKNCGKFVEADMTYCPDCGQRVGENNSSVSKSRFYDEEAIKMEQQGTVYDDEEDSPLGKITKTLAIVIVTALFVYTVYAVFSASGLLGKIGDFFDSLGNTDSIGTSAYYKDDTVSGALNTYLNALMSDDYETYLKITHNSDSDYNKSLFNDRKKGYTSVDSVSNWEVRTSTLFNLGASAEYMVAEYDSDGTRKENYSFVNGEDYSYGLVLIKHDYNSDTYYVSTHQRDFNFHY
ncbi:MAG: zinc ribbon domain-containing protein [Ruminococcus sp.]|nr:zinc ribbon domain-containing protein [Ruminococcus sp.]